MKKFIIFPLLMLLSICTLAQNADKYNKAMKKNLQALDTAFKSTASLLVVANNFERIGDAEKDQWLPYYYAAFAQVNIGFMEQDKSKVDAIADKATSLLDKADALSSSNSEISCIRSMIASCHMMVDPMSRYMQYGKESSEALEKAKTQDPSNPRPYFLIGQSLKYTPEQFGGGCGTSLPQIENALARYESFKPASDLAPTWGKELAESIAADCKK